MDNILGKIRSIAAPLARGFGAQLAPELTKGMLVEYLSKIDFDELIRYVKDNVILWEQLTPADQERARSLAKNLNDFSWLTTEWAIEAVRKDLPAVASLFLGWRKAKNWLARQVAIIRKELSG